MDVTALSQGLQVRGKAIAMALVKRIVLTEPSLVVGNIGKNVFVDYLYGINRKRFLGKVPIGRAISQIEAYAMQGAEDIRPFYLATFQQGISVAAHIFDREHARRGVAEQHRTRSDGKCAAGTFRYLGHCGNAMESHSARLCHIECPGWKGLRWDMGNHQNLSHSDAYPSL